MNLPTSAFARGALFARFLRSNTKIIQRDYSSDDTSGFPEELRKYHNVVPKNYKSFAGWGAPTEWHPAFNKDAVFKTLDDPNATARPGWSYRASGDNRSYFTTKGDKYIYYFLSTTMWAWITWRFYWDGYWHIMGEPEFSSAPDPSKWTDEELGIPNDDAMPPRLY